MTMILPKYEPNFAALTKEQAEYLAQAMDLPVVQELSGEDIFEIANLEGMDQADVVMCLATDATATGVQVVETLVGRPITRSRPASSPAQRGHRPRGPSVRRSDPRKIATVAPNPKKEGSASWARYELYAVGETIDQFLAKGGTMGDVKWDSERGFITFGEPPAAEETE